MQWNILESLAGVSNKYGKYEDEHATIIGSNETATRNVPGFLTLEYMDN
jgi:hypothetical protein